MQRFRRLFAASLRLTIAECKMQLIDLKRVTTMGCFANDKKIIQKLSIWVLYEGVQNGACDAIHGEFVARPRRIRCGCAARSLRVRHVFSAHSLRF